MTQVSLTAPTVQQEFPAGTQDPGFTYTVTGVLADGVTPFSQSNTSGLFSLDPGTYAGVVSKLGVSSKPSVPLILAVPTPVSLAVPDSAQAASLSIATVSGS